MDNLNNLPLLNIPLHIDRAFEDLCYEEKVLECSETILKFISTALSKSEQNEVALPKDVEDILKRLLNGLTSKDGFLKHGCYTTLQVLLQLHPEILPFTLACMEETFTKTKMVNKNDQTFGHVLALGALIRSGCVLNNPVLLKNVILKLGNAKTLSLSPIAGQFLVNLAMQKDGIIIKSLWKYLQGSLLHSFDSLTPCLMWLRFVLCRREYRKYLQNVPSNFYDEMIDVPSFTVIALTFKELFCNNVNVTPMIDDYFKSLILFCNDEHKGVDNLALFFSKAIMPLMQSPSFRNIIFIFSITQMALPHLTTGDHVGKVLSKELCELLIFSKKLRADQVESSARGLMEAILQHLIKNKKNLNSEIQLKTLKQLLSTSASLKFDAVMETSLLHQATDHLNPTAVIKLAECLIEKVKEYQESSLPPKSTIVQLIGNWLSRLVCLSNLRSSEHTELRASLLWMILELTFMKFPDQTVSALKKVFLRSLIQPTNNLEDLNRVIEIILEKANTMPFEGLPGKKTKVSFDNVSACLLQLKENKKIPKNQAPIFKVVCGHFMLHLIMNDGSMHFIDELMKCFEIGLQPRRKSAYEFHSDFYEDNSSTDWVEVTVELLLRILSKEESFWRKIVTNIFKNICHSLKPYSLYLLTDVIDPEKEADVLCSESEDEDMENLNSDDDSDIVENDRDEGSSSENDEMDACEGQKELKDDENEDLSNIVGDDEVADGENDDTENGSLIKIKMEMQKLVGDSESGVDVELDSVPQEELDNLDRRLGALVGQFISLRKKKHQIKKKLLSDETALMHFRIRVCQLLEVVIEEAPTLDHLVALIQPLLKALNRFSRDDLQKPLSQRLKTVIVGLSKVKKYDKPATLKAGDLVQELNFLSNLRENSSSRINEEIELCYTFLIRSGLHLPSKEENPSPADTLFITYAKHLEAITIKSSSNLIERPLQLDTPSIGIVLSKVLSLAFRSSLKPSRRKVLLDLIKLAFQNEKAIAKVPKNILSACFSDLNTNVIKTFNAILRPNQIQSKYLVALVELLKFLKNLHRGNRDLEMGFQWAEVVCVLSSFVKRIPLTDYKPLKKAIKAAEQSLQTPNCTGLQKEKKNGSKKMKIGFPKTETKPRTETVTKATSKIATEINDDEFSVKESDYDEFFIEDDDSCDSDDLDEKKFMLKMRNLEKDYETKRREVPFEKISKRHANKFGDPGPVSLNNNFKALIEARKEEKILKRQRKERNIEKKARKIKKKEKQSASKKVYVSTKKPKKSRKLLKIKREENKAARMEKRQMEKLGSLSFSVLNSL